MIPRTIFPQDACREYDGAGWEGVIEQRRELDQSALVRFTRAHTSSGRPYELVRLQLAALRAVPPA